MILNSNTFDLYARNDTLIMQRYIAYNLWNMSGKIKTKKELKDIISSLKKQDKRIVFTNGCFDILHYGHIKYLQDAKGLAEVLVVGLNSDSSVKRLKVQRGR